jgi:predicted CXXCH cytochrome family protein
MPKTKTLVLFAILIAFLSIAYLAYGASIVGSKHDLKSAWEKGSSLMRLSLNNYGEVCVYCHTPHGATNIAPLWNRNAPTGPYTIYASATMDTSPSNPPSGVSLACLSCHDGTVAVDSIINAPGSGANLTGPWYGQNAATYHFAMKEGANACGECHVGSPGHDARNTYIGTNLSKDHPISMSYPTTSQDPQFKTPPDVQKGWGGNLPTDVKLYAGKIECASCHNVHDPDVIPFLRKSNSGSVLCTTCHIK